MRDSSSMTRQTKQTIRFPVRLPQVTNRGSDDDTVDNDVDANGGGEIGCWLHFPIKWLCVKQQ